MAKTRSRKHEFEQVALALQGGGALGAYQAGAYAALAEGGVEPDWVAGVSIGAINAAIIAGNAADARVDALEHFWRRITRFTPKDLALPELPLPPAFSNMLSASRNLAFGQPAFFRPRLPPPFLWPDGAPNAISFYDIAPLRETLIEHVDFERLNHGPMRVSFGAVDVERGNYVYFDNRERRLGPEHVMASGALPPGFPPVEVEGRMYWDGGLAGNTPLDFVLHHKPRPDTLIFQIDLWPAHGKVPGNIIDVAERAKEIQYSSRTRLNSNHMVREMRLKRRVRELLERLADDEEARELLDELASECEGGVVNIVHLIYQSQAYEHDSKDYNFSRRMMEEHWHSGRADTERMLAVPPIFELPSEHEGIRQFASDKL